jgi:hypothetical protein
MIMRGWTLAAAGSRSPRAVLIGCLLLGLLVGACGRAATEPTVAPEPPTVTVDVYFANDTLGDLCDAVFPVARVVAADDPVTGALTALLAGPTAAERADGYRGWFSAATAGALLDVAVVDGTARVVFRDLRPVIPNASTSCGSAQLLAMLDTTLLALDDVDATRYALADQSAFYAWLQLADPDAPPSPAPAEETDEADEVDEVDEGASPAEEPGPAGPDAAQPDTPDGQDGAAPGDGADRPVDVDADWTPIATYDWPVQPGCCSMATVGPVSPDGPLPTNAWPDDGFYALDLLRPSDAETSLRIGLRRWVACADEPDEYCGDPTPEPGASDPRIVADPSAEVVRRVPIDALGAVLVPLADDETGSQRALEGPPGALAELLERGLDPAYRAWVYDRFLAGMSAVAIRDDLVERASQPGFVFRGGTCDPERGCTPLGYRGPHDTSLLVPLGGWEGLGRWPPGSNGLYGWQPITLEMRDGVPYVHLWAGPIAG